MGVITLLTPTIVSNPRSWSSTDPSLKVQLQVRSRHPFHPFIPFITEPTSPSTSTECFHLWSPVNPYDGMHSPFSCTRWFNRQHWGWSRTAESSDSSTAVIVNSPFSTMLSQTQTSIESNAVNVCGTGRELDGSPDSYRRMITFPFCFYPLLYSTSLSALFFSLFHLLISDSYYACAKSTPDLYSTWELNIININDCCRFYFIYTWLVAHWWTNAVSHKIIF